MRFLTLDVIRGLAALSVLISHWGGWTHKFQNEITVDIVRLLQLPIKIIWQAGGIHPGVIVFIVLSGFCIHLPCAKNPTLSELPGFWSVYAKRRIIRIYPVYWVALIVGLITALTISTTTYYLGGILLSLTPSLLGISEIARHFEVFNYIHLGNEPLSTVAVEILLYACYPAFIFLLRREKLKQLFFIAVTFYGLIVCLRFLGISPYKLHGTFFEFYFYWIWGAFCAEMTFQKNIRQSTRRIASATILLGFIYLFLVSFFKIKGIHVATTLLLSLTTGLMIASMIRVEERKPTLIRKLFSPLAKCGERGYSLYVMHTPIIFFSLWVIPKSALPDWTIPWLTLMAVFIGTELCYKIVEKPSHLLAQKLRIKT